MSTDFYFCGQYKKYTNKKSMQGYLYRCVRYYFWHRKWYSVSRWAKGWVVTSEMTIPMMPLKKGQNLKSKMMIAIAVTEASEHFPCARCYSKHKKQTEKMADKWKGRGRVFTGYTVSISQYEKLLATCCTIIWIYITLLNCEQENKLY